MATDPVLQKAIQDQERLRMGKEAMAQVIKKYGLAMQIAMVLKPPNSIEPIMQVILDPEFKQWPPSGNNGQ